MKRFLALLLVVALMLTSFAACGNPAEEKENGAVNGQEVQAENPEEPNAEPQDSQDETEDQDQEEENQKDKEQDKTTDKKTDSNTNANKPSKEGNTSSSKPNGGSSNSKPGKGDQDKNDDKGGEKDKSAPSGTPSEIIDKIYAKKGVDLPLATTSLDISDADALKSATGISSGSKVKSAAYSESMIGSQAYSLAVVRVKNSKDTEAIASEMLNGIDPRKWICVEADDVRVAAYDDLIMLIMVSSELSEVTTGKQMVSAFKSVCGGSLDVSLTK